jgi:hypothetical protein
MRACVLLFVALALAVPPAAGDQNAGGKGVLEGLGESIRQAWPPQGVSVHGAVRFVQGNDAWQPGRQFKAGKDWLGLACDVNGCTLEPAALAVKRESWQGHYDDQPTDGQKLRFRLEGAARGRSVVAWFSTAAAPQWLRPGPVPTAHSPLTPPRAPPGRGTLEAVVRMPGGGEAVLVPLAAQTEDVAGLGGRQSVLLQLRTPSARQLLLGTLGSCWGTFDPKRYLLWAGDLDRDGHLDLLVSFVDEDGPVHLYLSSVAQPGQLVGLAGVYLAPPFSGECS